VKFTIKTNRLLIMYNNQCFILQSLNVVAQFDFNLQYSRPAGVSNLFIRWLKSGHHGQNFLDGNKGNEIEHNRCSKKFWIFIFTNFFFFQVITVFCSSRKDGSNYILLYNIEHLYCLMLLLVSWELRKNCNTNLKKKLK